MATIGYFINGYWWLLVASSGYFINDYFLMVINGHW
jgi:hypothetical protein